jgi:hypothetical protein
MSKIKKMTKEELEQPTPVVLVCDSDEDMEKFMASLPARAQKMAEMQRKAEK